MHRLLPLLPLLASAAAAADVLLVHERRRLQGPQASCSTPLGQATSNTCAPAAGSCATNGASYYANYTQLTYSPSTGLFSGTLTANGCLHDARGLMQSALAIPWLTSVTAIGGMSTATCCASTFPAAGYSQAVMPKAAPLEGIVGISIWGEDVFGPLDNGFSASTQALCTTGTTGGCPKQSDVAACQNYAEAYCTTGKLATKWFLSDCGGHASPWHVHTSAACTLNSSWTWASLATLQGHSPLAAIMLDGRGLYGPFEAANQPPTTLDACNGHVGPVPAFSAIVNGVLVSYPAAASVYHYHVTSGAPFTVGCFGPVASVAAAMALAGNVVGCGGASGACSAADQQAGNCGTGYTWSACTSTGQLTNYLLGCTIFQGFNNGTRLMERNLQMFPNATAACPACTGSCGASSSPHAISSAPALRVAACVAVALAFAITLSL